jgi:hypothetical protein
MDSVARIKQLVRRAKGPGTSIGDDKRRQSYSRNSSQIIGPSDRPDTQLGLPIGREGNNWPYPDSTMIPEFNTDPGHRVQDFANSHLSEGPNPGRIPRFWNNRDSGKLGRNITGNRVGDQGLALDATGQANGGIGDAKYVQHIQIPRGQIIARAFARTVDDAANIPAVYVSDPTRR